MKKLKLSDEDFKEFLLDNYIDQNGNKVSDRELWSSESFMEKTGMFKLDRFSKKKLCCSTGTISYWKKKLNVREKDVFDYNQKITQKILNKIKYEEWSKMNNRGYHKIELETPDRRKNRLIRILGLDQTFRNYTFEEIMRLIESFWEDMGLNVEQQKLEVYEQLERSS